MRRLIVALIFAVSILLGAVAPALAGNPGLSNPSDDPSKAPQQCGSATDHAATHSPAESGDPAVNASCP